MTADLAHMNSVLDWVTPQEDWVSLAMKPRLHVLFEGANRTLVSTVSQWRVQELVNMQALYMGHQFVVRLAVVVTVVGGTPPYYLRAGQIIS